jgi:Ca2+-transporting ATPase
MLRQVPYARIQELPDPEQGLNEAAVIPRRQQYGANNIVDTAERNWRELARDTLRDPMLWFLLFTGSLFAWLGEYKEAAILALALVPLAGMDIYLHRRTQASTASLGGRLAPQTNVIRNGRQIAIPSRDIVCGDLVILGANDFLPADGLIMDAHEAQLDESALTGEAFPVRKKPYRNPGGGDSDGNAAIDTDHWGFAGTRLLAGNMRLGVLYTGHETYYGQIVQSALHGRHARTPMQIAIANLVSVLLIAAVLICLVLALVRWSQGFGLLDAVLSAITLAVAALPEEFPVVFTFFLGVGVYRLAKRRALVRRAVAVENIGRVTTICSDKTGTLTHGRLTLSHSYPAPSCSAAQLLETARMASRSESRDPMDQAIIAIVPHEGNGRRLATFPFTEDRKKETAIISVDGQRLAAAKGAPETILRQCGLSAAEHAALIKAADELAGEGHKVIACARRILNATEPEDIEPQTDFEYAGFLALEDPVREGVTESVRFCRQAGIHILMITGDHPLTARAVAREIGLGDGEPKVLTAEELEAAIKADPRTDLRRIDVIARSIPAQKLHFVRQLQAKGEIVAVTGDGVNDVPALQAADVGIAMGERGTQAAREVSAIVLLDDNFRTIARAIAEGAQLFHNLRMSCAYLLLVHIPLVISAALIPFMGFPLLYLPIHIVWLELIIHPTALLAYQQLPDHERMPAIKIHTGSGFFTRGEWILILLSGLLITATLVYGYMLNLGAERNVEHARAMALAVLCLGSAFFTMTLTRLATAASRLVVAGTIGSALLFIQLPAVANLLHLQPLHPGDWLTALLASGLIAMIPGFANFGSTGKRISANPPDHA